MSQQDVYKVLKRNKRWMTAIEIAKKLNAGVQSIRINLMVLFRHNEVLRQPSESGYFTYSYKINEGGI